MSPWTIVWITTAILFYLAGVFGFVIAAVSENIGYRSAIALGFIWFLVFPCIGGLSLVLAFLNLFTPSDFKTTPRPMARKRKVPELEELEIEEWEPEPEPIVEVLH